MFSGAAASAAFLMKRMLSCGYVGRALTGMCHTHAHCEHGTYGGSPVIQLVRSGTKADLSDGMEYLGGHGTREIAK